MLERIRPQNWFAKHYQALEDRGSEFKDELIDDALKTFSIQRLLSMKGCPYVNAVVEAALKVVKTEFANGVCFSSLDQLEFELNDYVN